MSTRRLRRSLAGRVTAFVARPGPPFLQLVRSDAKNNLLATREPALGRTPATDAAFGKTPTDRHLSTGFQFTRIWFFSPCRLVRTLPFAPPQIPAFYCCTHFIHPHPTVSGGMQRGAAYLRHASYSAGWRAAGRAGAWTALRGSLPYTACLPRLLPHTFFPSRLFCTASFSRVAPTWCLHHVNGCPDFSSFGRCR